MMLVGQACRFGSLPVLCRVLRASEIECTSQENAQKRTTATCEHQDEERDKKGPFKLGFLMVTLQSDV